MASSTKIAYHVRSISLPTRSNPLTITVEEQLCQLRSSELATSSSISHNLAGLKDLFESVEDFLQMQSTKQSLSNNSVEGVLNGSDMLLDVCGTISDVLSLTKQSVQELQSSIRRRTNEIGAYMASRKKVTKVIRKCLSDLKKMNNKNNDFEVEVNVLKEVEATTLAIFESILSFLSGPKQSNWPLVSKLVSTKRVEYITEVMMVDIALKTLEINDVQKALEALEMSIQDLEARLESISRCLIKNRVSLLNIFNN